MPFGRILSIMPRRNRCVLPGVAGHITQRGVDRRETFSSDEDRQRYLRPLRQTLGDAGVSLLGWWLMTNHVHLVALPAREDSSCSAIRSGPEWSGGRPITAGPAPRRTWRVRMGKNRAVQADPISPFPRLPLTA